MKTLSLSEARTKLSSLIDEIRDRDVKVTITRNGRPVAVLVSSDEFEIWKETVSIRADAELGREIRQGLAAIKERNAKLYSLEELFDQEPRPSTSCASPIRSPRWCDGYTPISSAG